MFKVVCISNYMDSEEFDVGEVYEAEVYGVKMFDKKTHYVFENGAINVMNKFLRLPTEPKTCADMTMEEYLAMACLRSFHRDWVVSTSGCRSLTEQMPEKSNRSFRYSIKPSKSPQEIEIERIECEMRKLADALEELRTKGK